MLLKDYTTTATLSNIIGGEEEAGERGVSKINVDTDLRLAMTAQIRRVFNENPEVFDPRKYLGVARDEIKNTVLHKINDVFCSANKA